MQWNHSPDQTDGTFIILSPLAFPILPHRLQPGMPTWLELHRKAEPRNCVYSGTSWPLFPDKHGFPKYPNLSNNLTDLTALQAGALLYLQHPTCRTSLAAARFRATARNGEFRG